MPASRVPQRAAPVLAVALAGLVVVLAAPATADMAAHAFRSELWEREGFTVWNAHWYGGHHVPGYSLLFPPLGALLGPRIVGALAGAAAVWAFGALTASQAARWLFASGVAANVVVGRMPFTLGIALGVAAWLAAERSHRGGAGVLAAATTLASPVAGIFLVLASLVRGRDGWVLVVPAAAAGIALGVLFPTGGTERFVATAFWPALALTGAAALLLAGRARTGALLAAALMVAAFAIPDPLGQNALRLPLLIGPALLVACAPRRALPVLAVVAGLVYLQWLPAVRAVGEAHGDPSTQSAYFDEVREVVSGERTEVVFTRNHWEAAHLAFDAPLARGWERQLDRRHNALFYEEGLSAERYLGWLRENGVRYVALPAVTLDYSAREEAALLRAGIEGLEPVHSSERWLIWSVDGAPGGERVLSADSFSAPAGPTFQRWTRYWEGPVRETAGGRVELLEEATVGARFGR